MIDICKIIFSQQHLLDVHYNALVSHVVKHVNMQKKDGGLLKVSTVNILTSTEHTYVHTDMYVLAPSITPYSTLYQ